MTVAGNVTDFVHPPVATIAQIDDYESIVYLGLGLERVLHTDFALDCPWQRYVSPYGPSITPGGRVARDV